MKKIFVVLAIFLVVSVPVFAYVGGVVVWTFDNPAIGYQKSGDVVTDIKEIEIGQVKVYKIIDGSTVCYNSVSGTVSGLITSISCVK